MVYNIHVTKNYGSRGILARILVVVKREADFPYCSVMYKEKMAENRLKISKKCLKIVKVN